MNEFLNFLEQALKNKIDDLAIIFIAAAFFVTTFYWMDYSFSKTIHSKFLRRNLVCLILASIYTGYYIISIQWEPIDFHYYILSHFIGIVNSFVFFNIYNLISHYFSKTKIWNSLAKSLIIFVLIWLGISFTVGIQLLWNSIRENSTDVELAKRLLFFKQLLPYFFLVSLTVSSIDFICAYLFKLQEFKKKVKELETITLREQLTKAQLDALHAKVNPHFLYNSLNSIAGLALNDGQKTQQMAVSLSKFFRYSINHKEDNLVTVGEELEMAETYLKIEQIRFEERLNYKIIKDSETEEIKIPRFILQPLVENSVKHGMKGNEHSLAIKIHAQLEGKKLSLSVQDDGLPFGNDFRPGYGLKSIYDKLDILFPEKYEVALYNEPVKQVRILIET